MEIKYPLSIKEWPEDERPRERLVKFGAESLSSAELLAIILRTGSKGKSALDYARGLLSKYDGFREIESISVAELTNVSGIGLAKAAQIKAVFEIAKRYSGEKMDAGTHFQHSRQVFNHFHEPLRAKKKEVFIALLLDAKNRMLREAQISEGSLTSSIVHPREVFNTVVKHSAASIILVHNHPSGDPTPSSEDKDITKRLKQGGELLGINILDHVIIGDGRYVSFADQGLM